MLAQAPQRVNRLTGDVAREDASAGIDTCGAHRNNMADHSATAAYSGKHMTRSLLAALAAATVLTSAASAADKGAKFWNLTSATVTKLYISPAGKDAYGPDQCANDKDGEVDHDERLKVTAEPGKSDLKVAFAGGKECIVKGVDIVAGKVFSIEDKDLTVCNK